MQRLVRLRRFAFVLWLVAVPGLAVGAWLALGHLLSAGRESPAVVALGRGVDVGMVILWALANMAAVNATIAPSLQRLSEHRWVRPRRPSLSPVLVDESKELLADLHAFLSAASSPRLPVSAIHVSPTALEVAAAPDTAHPRGRRSVVSRPVVLTTGDLLTTIALVCAGQDRDGLVFVDLASREAIAFEGSVEDRTVVAIEWLRQLQAAPWCQDVELAVYGSFSGVSAGELRRPLRNVGELITYIEDTRTGAGGSADGTRPLTVLLVAEEIGGLAADEVVVAARAKEGLVTLFMVDNPPAAQTWKVGARSLEIPDIGQVRRVAWAATLPSLESSRATHSAAAHATVSPLRTA